MSESTELARATPDVGALLQTAVTNNLGPEAMRELFELHRDIEANNARKAFFDAIQRFQERCPPIVKDRTAGAGSYSYRYATLEEIASVIRPHLAECGLSYSFDCTMGDGSITTTCRVRHVAGHSETSTFTAPIDGTAKMNAMQKTASATSYANRYALRNALGLTIAEEDDDGHAASPVEPPSQRQGGPTAQPRAERVSKDDLADLHGYWKETMTGLGADTSPEAFRQFIVDNGGPALEPNKTNSWSKDQVTSVGKAVDRLRGEK